MSGIPFIPGIVLGNPVPTDVFTPLKAAWAIKNKVDSTQDELNGFNHTLRSLDLTLKELNAMGVPPGQEMDDTINELKDTIKKKALELAKLRFSTRVEYEKNIMDAKSKIGIVHYESPIDYNKSNLKNMPLSSDSMNADVQYFSFDSNVQNSESYINTIKAYVSASSSYLGTEYSGQASASVQKQLSRQMQNHKIEGTLVITANCTHKNAKVFAPFIIDADKGIESWNKTYPDDKLIVPDGIIKASEEEESDNNVINLVSGVTTGSSFIGLVYVLRNETTRSSQEMASVASSMSAQMKAGGWFSSVSGGFGVDSSFSDDVKNMLSTQTVLSHVSIITTGVIPSIKSNNVRIGVKELADFDPAKMMEKLGTLASATKSDQRSMDDQADAARTGKQMINFRNEEIKSVMLGLGEIDDGQNKIIDINSLMTAFEEFVQVASKGDGGVPINYYIKPITKVKLAKLWVDKYFPGKYMVPNSNE